VDDVRDTSPPVGGSRSDWTERALSGVNFFRITQGRIAEIWNLRDDLGLREQVLASIYAGFPDGDERSD